MSKHRPDRQTAKMEGSFVVFLIGMRINRLWAVHRWWPVFASMPAMLEELSKNKELGLLGFRPHFGRTTMIVQYWESSEKLIEYANSKEMKHRSAWQEFFRKADGSVGVWHETYEVDAGAFETMYVDMPPFGLGLAGALVPAEGSLKSAKGRLGRDLDSAQTT